MFQLNVAITVIWKVIFHVTETLSCRRVLLGLIVVFPVI